MVIRWYGLLTLISIVLIVEVVGYLVCDGVLVICYNRHTLHRNALVCTWRGARKTHKDTSSRGIRSSDQVEGEHRIIDETIQRQRSDGVSRNNNEINTSDRLIIHTGRDQIQQSDHKEQSDRVVISRDQIDWPERVLACPQTREGGILWIGYKKIRFDAKNGRTAFKMNTRASWFR